MENILKKSSGRTERFVLAFAIAVVIVFGVLNPLTYVTDFNTAQEISCIFHLSSASFPEIQST